jgi:exonuclease SbcC
MRPRYLEIEGLQSFKEVQKIDFDKLSETGLFGIFGPTGSGKSTILDAITLALYGKVHRANMGTQGIVNAGCSSVKVSFVFDLLKGDKRKTYRVDRIYNKKKDSEISCEAKVARLIEVFDEAEVPIADKPTDVNKKMEELLGLKHDDFTRAVVLPQNQFQEFLLLEKAKKREMLERIFYLEEYGKQLNVKLSRKISHVKMRLSNVQGALSALGDASKEALEEAKNILKETEESRKNAIQELKDIETLHTEAKELWQLVGELEFVKNKEKKHLEALEEIQNKRELLDKALKAEGLIEIINDYKEITAKLEETEKQLSSVFERLPELEKELEKTKISYQEKLKEWEIEKPKLLENKTKLGNALELKKEIDEIDRKIGLLQDKLKKLDREIVLKDKELENSKDNIKNMEEEIKQCNLNIESLKVDSEYKKEIQNGLKLENELASAMDNFKGLNTKKDKLALIVSQSEKKLAEIKKNAGETENKLKLLDSIMEEHKKSKPGERDDITNLIENYHNYKSIFGFIKAKEVDMNSINTKIIEKTKLLGVYRENLDMAEISKNNIESEADKLEQELKFLKMQIEQDTAYMIAKSLKEGEPCPVCGSTNHPSPAHYTWLETGIETRPETRDKTRTETKTEVKTEIGSELGPETENYTDDSAYTIDHNLYIKDNIKELEDKLKRAELEYSKYEAALREAEKKCMHINEQVRSENDQVIQLKTDLEKKKEEMAKLKEELPDKMKWLTLELMEKEIEKLNNLAEEKQKEIDIWEKRLDTINEKIKKGEDILNSYKVDESSVKSQFKVNKENLKSIENDMENACRVFNEKDKLFKDFINKYNIKGASTELERIANNERDIEQFQEKIKQKEEQVKIIRNKLDELQEERQKLGNIFSQFQTEHKNAAEIKAEKRLKVKELGGECNIEDEIKLIDKKLLDIGRQDKALSELIKKLEEQYNKMNLERSTLENQRKIYKENLERDNYRLEVSLKEKGFNNKEEAQKSVIKKEKRKELKEEIDEYEKVEGNLTAQKNLLLKKLDNRNITEEEWNKIDQLYNKKVELKDNAVSQDEIAKSNFKRTKERHEEWVKLNNENNELSNKADRLDQIRSLLRGNSFIDFVAEERLRYIAREASEILGVLTKYKYALELDPDIGFIIRDNANGGVHRMVTSLSGGETFITSLSLALALSKQIQLKGQSPLEFFFLDEGFGTLDRNLLDIVIDSLQRLSTTDRVIGLISHVPELKNRIARRLIVEPPTADGMGSRISIEKA